MGLSQPMRIVKLRTNRMSNPAQSEGEQLAAILDDLQRESQIKEIAGWRSGFNDLDRALDGISPGLYWLVGPSGCGKTAFARQLLDQVALHNAVPGIYFTFTESKNELRIKTLARLSEIENREIRRGSAYLLHWYGVPRLGGEQASQLSASWEKLRRSAEEAKSWLDRVYLFECDRASDVDEIEKRIGEVLAAQRSDRAFVVIDDCQRLARAGQPTSERINAAAEALQAAARALKVPIFAVATTAGGDSTAWAERILSPDVILEAIEESSQQQTRAVRLRIVKNRCGERGTLAFEFLPAFAKFVEVGAAK